MRGVRTVGMLAHESCSLAYLRYGRVCERVEEVVFGQHERAPNALGIGVFERLERLLERPARCCGERSSGQCDLRLRWSFGGMIPQGRNILGEWPERVRRPQWQAGALDER
jgi:hypothetical protein